MDEVITLLRGDVTTVGIVVCVLALIVSGRLIPRAHHLEVVAAMREQLVETRSERDHYRNLAHAATDGLDRSVDLATRHRLTQPATADRPAFQPRIPRPGGDDD